MITLINSHFYNLQVIHLHISNMILEVMSFVLSPGVGFTKVFRTELGHKYILVEYSVIALCLPVVSKLYRYKLVCYK